MVLAPIETEKESETERRERERERERERNQSCSTVVLKTFSLMFFSIKVMEDHCQMIIMGSACDVH